MTLSDKSDVTGYDFTSNVVHISSEERFGFAVGYQLRRHRDEAKAHEAFNSCRRDWQRYIGPIEQFGNANPYHGNFLSLTLPYTLPDRVPVIGYLLEC
jgi:hypothetical protein